MTKNELMATEEKFGGRVDDVPRRIFSEYDFDGKGKKTLHTGGDRMHQYGEYYANYFEKYLNKEINLFEVGVLLGTGLAIWSEIFPKANIYGLDIEPQNYFNNCNKLIELGAFTEKLPIVHGYDQLRSVDQNTVYLKKILGNKRVDIVIDDGCHTKQCAINTFKSFLPYLSDDFTYVIEDQVALWRTFRKRYPSMNTMPHAGNLTIITK